MNVMNIPIHICKEHTGSSKIHDNWKTTWGLLTESLERMKFN